MKLQMVGSHTPPKGNAMPEDCIRCHNAEWGTIVIDSVCVSCVIDELAALREAGEKMAERLRDNRSASAMANSTIQKVLLFSQKDSDALAEWEAANK